MYIYVCSVFTLVCALGWVGEHGHVSGGGQQLNANASLLKVLKKINSISKGVLLHEDQP